MKRRVPKPHVVGWYIGPYEVQLNEDRSGDWSPWQVDVRNPRGLVAFKSFRTSEAAVLGGQRMLAAIEKAATRQHRLWRVRPPKTRASAIEMGNIVVEHARSPRDAAEAAQAKGLLRVDDTDVFGGSRYTVVPDGEDIYLIRPGDWARDPAIREVAHHADL